MKRFLMLLMVSHSLFAHEVHIGDHKDEKPNMPLNKNTFEYLIQKFKFSGQEKILDLGCGDGTNTAYLTALIPKGKVLGLDWSEELLASAKVNFPIYQYPNLSFDKANEYNLNYENEFDIIFSFSKLQWAEDHKQVLMDIKKALKLNGTIAISMPMGLPLTMQEAVEEMENKEKWRPFFKDFSTGFNFISLEDYESLLENLGFEINLIEKRGQKEIFQNKEALSAFMAQWLPHLKVIPNDLKEEFMSQFLNRYLQLEGVDLNSENSIYFFPNHLMVIAHKK